MIVVRIWLWPGGFERGKKLLGKALIINDLTGDERRGNYEVRLGKPEQEDLGVEDNVLRRGRIEGFDRTRQDPWDLLLRSLLAAVGDRLEKGDR